MRPLRSLRAQKVTSKKHSLSVKVINNDRFRGNVGIQELLSCQRFGILGIYNNFQDTAQIPFVSSDLIPEMLYS